MRTLLILLLALLTAFSTAAQVPIYEKSPRSLYAREAELHFNDGTSRIYPVMRISKDLVRVRTEADQSTRIPLQFIHTVKFMDGTTLSFDNGRFEFDKLTRPAFLQNESGDVLLEGVLQLSKDQAASMMGAETWREYKKANRILQTGVFTIAGGTILLVPYLGGIISNLPKNQGPIDTFKGMPPAWKGVTIGGGCVLIGGIVLAILGNNGCNRVIAAYNDGAGLKYSF